MTELPEHDDFGDYGSWPGRAVLDPTGRRLGEVREIYLDDATDRPEWVLVELEGEAPRFVPLADATVADDAIRVAQASDRIEAAPALEPSKELTQEEERRLYSHYGLRYSEDESDSILPDLDQPSPADAETARGDATPAPPPPDEPDTAGGDGDEARPHAAAPTAMGTSEAGGPGSPPLAAAAAVEGLGRPKLRRHQGADPALPPPGKTSEPEDEGPMVPPRPEPVAPPRLDPEPESGGPLGFVRERPVPVAAGVAGLIAVIVFILLRRR